jgi:hypothetical protein
MHNMQKDDNKLKDAKHCEGNQAELSNVWRELLGLHRDENSTAVDSDQQIIPMLEGDPWQKLLEAENIELVDLQQVHIPVSEGEVELMLELMQEQTTQGPNDGKDAKQ